MKLFGGIITVCILSTFLPAFGFEPEALNCSAGNMDYVKFSYKSQIDGINDAIRLYEQSHSNYTIESVASYIYTPFLNAASDSAQCLGKMGINPQDVDQLSPEAQKVFSYDPVALNKTAPLFVKYVPIPEFPFTLPVLLLSLILLLVFYGSKFRIKIKHIFDK